MYNTDKTMLKKIKKESKRGVLERRSGGQKVVFGIAFAIIAIYAATLIFALWWMGMSSFKDPLEFADTSNSAIALPEKWIIQKRPSNIGENR